MSALSVLAAPGLAAQDTLAVASGKQSSPSGASLNTAKATAQDFEAVFLNTIFQQMFTGLEGEGPFGGNGASGVWRSFLTDEYAKNFAKAGGIGIADHVYSALIARQAGQS